MKHLILFCTKIYVYWVEIPLIMILIGAIKFNSTSESLLRLYPLIITSALAIVFVILYFFNAVLLSYSKIKKFGLFSSKSSAIINKGKTLVLTYLPKRKICVELYELQSKPALEWINNDDFTPVEANIFRERIIGSNGAAKRILKFFGVNNEEISELISKDEATIECRDFTLKSDVFEEKKRIHIKFKTTI